MSLQQSGGRATTTASHAGQCSAAAVNGMSLPHSLAHRTENGTVPNSTEQNSTERHRTECEFWRSESRRVESGTGGALRGYREEKRRNMGDNSINECVPRTRRPWPRYSPFVNSLLIKWRMKIGDVPDNY